MKGCGMAQRVGRRLEKRAALFCVSPFLAGGEPLRVMNEAALRRLAAFCVGNDERPGLGGGGGWWEAGFSSSKQGGEDMSRWGVYLWHHHPQLADGRVPGQCEVLRGGYTRCGTGKTGVDLPSSAAVLRRLLFRGLALSWLCSGLLERVGWANGWCAGGFWEC